ncbi:MAG TPA: GatB/YqeY domain-containing protein [Patescibacteria group bacterium]|nr:GatB/YqeY domain-containing protein [Patescibacteria group bacterium]
MSSLKDKIERDFTAALKQRAAVKLSTLRLLKSAIEKRAKERPGELTDEDILKIIRQEVKKRQDAIEMFGRGNRTDLADKEKEELAVLADFLPPELSAEQLKEIVAQVIKENNFTAADFGTAMKAAMAATGNGSDGQRVSALVKELLS